MNVRKTQMAVVSAALTHLDLTNVVATLATDLLQTDTSALV